MLPSKEPNTSPSLRKLEPQAKLPTAAVLRTLSSFEVRLLRRRLSEPVEYVFNPCFQQPEAEARFASPSPADYLREHVVSDSDDSGVDLFGSPKQRALTQEQEQGLFLRLNYCRYRVMRVIQAHRGRQLSGAAARELLTWDRRAAETRGEIVRANVPLVLAMAKRTKLAAVDFADLVSEGNLALLRSVDKFDCSRGFKFSTYACRAILKSFSRVAARAARYRGRFPTEFDPALEKGNLLEQKRLLLEDECVDELRSILGSNLAKLNEVEQRVIRARFALGERCEDTPPRAKTLEQVGEMIGVTKERVRQIQNKALVKLRTVLEEGVLAG